LVDIEQNDGTDMGITLGRVRSSCKRQERSLDRADRGDSAKKIRSSPLLLEDNYRRRQQRDSVVRRRANENEEQRCRRLATQRRRDKLRRSGETRDGKVSRLERNRLSAAKHRSKVNNVRPLVLMQTGCSIQSPLTRIRFEIRSRTRSDQNLLILEGRAARAMSEPRNSRVHTKEELQYSEAIDLFRDPQFEDHRQQLLRNAETMMSMSHILTSPCGICEMLTERWNVIEREVTLELKKVIIIC
jgi:hypothetical protein